MRRIHIALVLVLVITLGCAGSQPVRIQLPPSARIGILNVLEPQMTHVDVGSFRIDSFTNVYNVDWDIPGYVSRKIETDLRARGSYTFIPLAVNADAGWKQSMSAGIVSAVNSWMPGDLKAFLEQAAADNRLDLIISVSSYDSGTWQQDACFEIGKSDVVNERLWALHTDKASLGALQPAAGRPKPGDPVCQHHRGRFPAPPGDPGCLRGRSLQQGIPAGFPLGQRPSVSRPGRDQAGEALPSNGFPQKPSGALLGTRAACLERKSDDLDLLSVGE